MKDFSYSVAIRTLGTAGEKYQMELESIIAQTIKPQKIVVYIAEGYPIPKETVGVEEYVYVKKGMVAQRALDYSEISDEWILLLDDDMQLPPDYVEKAYAGAKQFNADCVNADLFGYNEINLKRKIVLMMVGSYPLLSDKWGFTIGKNGRFNYNPRVRRNFYRSQTGAGGCIFIKKKCLLAIEFDQELWMDEEGYPMGEDQVFNYKLYKNGYNLITYYNNGIVNLDAASGGKGPSPQRYRNNNFLLFVLWYRTCMDISTNRWYNKIACLLAYIFRLSINLGYVFVSCIRKFRLFYFTGYILGIVDGIAYVNSSKYRIHNNFIVSKHTI